MLFDRSRGHNKMVCKKQWFSILLVALFVHYCCGAIRSDSNYNRHEAGRGFDAKGMFSSLAGTIMGRSGYVTATGTGSQVVSLNLTNLLVLVLLKALIFAAGSLGAGAWKGGYGRSLDGEETFITDDEFLLFLSYLTGSSSCLQNVACKTPNETQKYATAGEMLLKASKVLSIDTDNAYSSILQNVQEAVDVGLHGGSCDRYECAPESRK